MASHRLWAQEEIQRLENAFRSFPDGVSELSDSYTSETDRIGRASLITAEEVDRAFHLLLTSEDQQEASGGQNEERSSVSGPTSHRSYRSIPFTFEIDEQKRPGAHHGRGRRPRAMTGSELQQSIGPQIARKICRLLLSRSDYKPLTLAERLKDTFIDMLQDGRGSDSIEIPDDYIAIFEKRVGIILNVKEKSGYETIPAPFLSTCFKVPRSAPMDSRGVNAMERHVACTWLDLFGDVHCTCVGSTTYRIAMHSAEGTKGINCVHANGIQKFLSVVTSAFNVSPSVAGKMLARFFIAANEYGLPSYTNSLPQMHFLYKGSIIVVAGIENSIDRRNVMFAPVRHITKGSVRNVCAFCDNIYNAGCHHTRTITMLENDGEDATQRGKSYTTLSSNTAEEDFSNSISVLPLSPVNCGRTLEVDEMICSLARASKPYLVTAPSECSACGSPRNEASRKVWNDGIIMCTIGPCKMNTEQFLCSSSSCNRTIVSEGREHCLLMHTLSSSATHAFLRRELYGVVISNGTLTGRLNHYHSLVTANACFGIVPTHPPCRSVKTIVRLCSSMLKLMCIRPPTSVFCCKTCEYDGETLRPRLMSLCMDGINQGFSRANAKSFTNICEPCIAPKAATMTARGRAESLMRPLTCLVREQRPVKLLLDAIRGKSLCCTKTTEKDFASAIRMVSDSALPPEFYSSVSVCGRSRGDVSNDIGPCSVLANIRRFVTSIFDEKTLLYRLISPLLDTVHNASVRQLLVTATSALEIVSSSSTAPGVCWSPMIPNINVGHIRNDLFSLFRLIIQGPVVQFVKKSDTTSLEALCDRCCSTTFHSVRDALQNPSILLPSVNSSDTNILQSLKVLQAGVLSVTELEKSRGASDLRHSIGCILRDCNRLVIRFHAFYDIDSHSATAFDYRRRWSSMDGPELKDLMTERYGFPNVSQSLLTGNDFDLAMRTGAYFPGRPQLRPLPFNDERVTDASFESIESCSKDYLQRQKSFTPGALTFCCSCPHPKILGFKVLYRNEGPRAILDTVLSRFAAIPNYLIYDFCCGLFVSAIHCLWWALSNASIVCDNFHSKNHSCSPGYSPKAHVALNNTNTVSHEQRNRAITRLGLSLRNCNQNLYVSLLAYQTIILNIRAQAKGTRAFQSRDKKFSEYDIEWCYFHCLELQCSCCNSQP